MVEFEEIKDKLTKKGSTREDFQEKVDLLNKMAYEIRKSDPDKAISITKLAVETSDEISYKQGKAFATFIEGMAKENSNLITEAFELYKVSLKLFEELNDAELMARALRAIGKVYKKQFKHNEAIDFLGRALAKYEEVGDKNFQAISASEMAHSYHMINDYALALEHYIKALKLFEELGDKAEISRTYNKIANINWILGESEEALEYYNKSLNLKRELNDRENEAITLMNIGNIYNAQNDYKRSLTHYNQALKINKDIGHKVNEGACLINIADSQIKSGLLDEAEKNLDEAKKIFDANDDKIHKASLFLTYGELFYGRTQYYEAIQFANDAHEIAKEISSKDLLMDVYKFYSDCSRELEDHEKAYEYFKKYYQTKNEIFTKETYERIKNMQYKYEREAALKEADFQKKRGEELEKALKKVEELNENLQRMNEEKNTFMALVAHDLKNPLNAILGYAQLVKLNPEQFEQDDYIDMFDDIDISARNMTELITNYLEFTTIEAGKMKLTMKEVNLSRSAKNVVDSFRARANAKGILLDFKSALPEIKILADNNAIIQILDNLVSNAIKFSPSGKKVILSIAENKDRVTCEVRDFGPGISKKDMPKLFKKFSRLTARPTAGESSTGLGLSIAKKLTEEMNGTIRCESVEGEGASFIIEFPSMH